MALKKLEIKVEKRSSPSRVGDKTVLVFEKNSWLSALYNPNKLGISKSVNWAPEKAAGHDVPEIQFTNAEPRTLSLELIFDTYDSPDREKKDVREYTQKLFQLTTVEKHGDKHRPPVCRLSWGVAGMFFQGVLQQLEQQFTLFMEDGKPVRATSRCTFKEWRTTYEGLNRQDRQSSDIAKTWVVKRGETLSDIATEEYRDASLWRPIAAENEIDDPLRLVPGTVLLIPSLTQRNAKGRYSS
jgi:nucleoid-associated protein YgaU